MAAAVQPGTLLEVLVCVRLLHPPPLEAVLFPHSPARLAQGTNPTCYTSGHVFLQSLTLEPYYYLEISALLKKNKFLALMTAKGSFETFWGPV